MNAQDISLTAEILASNAVETRGVLDPEREVAYALTIYLIQHASEWASEDDADFRYEPVVSRFFNS